MTISASFLPDEYTAASSQTDFEITFDFDDATTEIVAYVEGVLEAGWSVSGTTLTFDDPLTAGDNVYITRSTPLRQSGEFAPSTSRAQALEDAFDELTRICQDIRHILNRVPVMAEARTREDDYDISSLELPALDTITLVAGGDAYFSWGDDGNALVLREIAAAADAVGLLSSTLQTTTVGALGATGTAGRARSLTDDNRGIRVDSGLGWHDPGHHVFDVKAFGAIGDFTTDDTSAINAAITACPNGGIVFFPPGIYKTTSAITVTKPLTIRGAGFFIDHRQAIGHANWHDSTRTGGTVIRTTITSGVALTFLEEGIYNNQMHLENIAIIGPGSGTGDGVWFGGVEAAGPTGGGLVGSRVTNVLIANFGGVGFLAGFDNDSVITGLRVISNGTGLRMYEKHNSNTYYGLETHNNNIGVQITSAGNSRIIGGTIQSSATYGLQLDGGAETLIQGVYFENNGASGSSVIQSTPSSRNVLKDCHFSSTNNDIDIDVGTFTMENCRGFGTFGLNIAAGAFVFTRGTTFGGAVTNLGTWTGEDAIDGDWRFETVNVPSTGSYNFYTDATGSTVDSSFVLSSSAHITCNATFVADPDLVATERVRVFSSIGSAGYGNIYSGQGDPEGALVALVGSLYLRHTDGGSGSTLYVKETGSGNTGWVGI